MMQEALGFMRSEGAEPEDEDDAGSEVLDIDDPKFRRPDPHGDYLRARSDAGSADYLRAHSDAGSAEAGDGDRWLRSVAESADVDVISQVGVGGGARCLFGSVAFVGPSLTPSSSGCLGATAFG